MTVKPNMVIPYHNAGSDTDGQLEVLSRQAGRHDEWGLAGPGFLADSHDLELHEACPPHLSSEARLSHAIPGTHLAMRLSQVGVASRYPTSGGSCYMTISQDQPREPSNGASSRSELASRPGTLGPEFWYLFLGGIALLCGVVFRFRGLGTWAVAQDEYFLLTSIGYIFENGIPTFPQGGYYTRGLLIQYLTIPLILLTDAPEWSLRFLSVAANLAAIPAVFLIGRRLGGSAVAALAVILFSLSVWEVEFARYGRMYAPFQALFLWQSYLLIRVCIDGDHRFWKVMIGLSLAALLVYEGAVFLWLLAVIPLLRRDISWSIGRIAASGVVLAALLLWERTNFRRMGQPPPYPEGYGAGGAEGSSFPLPIHPPPMGLNEAMERGWWIVPVGILCAIGGWASWRLWRSVQPDAALLWSGLIAFAALNLFSLVGLASVVAWLGRPKAFLEPLGDAGHRRRFAVFGVVALGIWSALYFAGGLGPYDVVKRFLNYPPLMAAVVDQWTSAIPLTTALLALVLGLRLVLEMASRRPAPVWRLLAAGALLTIAAAAAVPTGQLTSRYTFFVYGIILLLFAESIWRFATFALGDRLRAHGAIALAFLCTFWIAEDYSAAHLLGVHTAEVNYRVGMSSEKAAHLTVRDDYRGPAEYVNASLSPDDIVILSVGPVAYYLERLDYSLVDEEGFGFRDVAAVRGTRELWSDTPIIPRPDAIYAVACGAQGSTWVILREDPFNVRGPAEAALRDRLSEWREYENFDRTIAVYRVPASSAVTFPECATVEALAL